MNEKRKYNLIDLFAGAGGLSTGFCQTDKFNVIAAVENNKHMQNTYRLNHKKTDMYSDILKVDFKEFLDKYEHIDVLVGGPPCQGFSNANRQHTHIVNMNNQLTKSFIDAVIELSPKVFVLENVSMLASNTHMFFCQNDDVYKIRNMGIAIHTKHSTVSFPEDVCGYVLELYNLKYDFTEIILNDDEFTAFNVIYKRKGNENKLAKTLNSRRNQLKLALKQNIERYRHIDNDLASFVRETAENLLESLNRNIDMKLLEYFVTTHRSLKNIVELMQKDIFIQSCEVKSSSIVFCLLGYTVIDYIRRVLSDDYLLEYKVLNAINFGAPQNRSRFILIGCLKEVSKNIAMPRLLFENDFNTVGMAISDLEAYTPHVDISNKSPIIIKKEENRSPLQAYLNDASKIHNHINTKSRKQSVQKFEQLKQGQNFHDLSEEFKTDYSKPKRTQNSIYKRLSYDKPSGTVVNVRKSMWIHPVHDRAVSIREAARLQTFPDSYVFTGPKDSQYQQVGNAVPPVLARAVAESVLELLNDKPKVLLKDALKHEIEND